MEGIKLQLKSGLLASNVLKTFGLDYLFAYDKGKEVYAMLNVEAYGEFSEDKIQQLAKAGKKVAVIDGLYMTVYNYTDDEVAELAIALG